MTMMTKAEAMELLKAADDFASALVLTAAGTKLPKEHMDGMYYAVQSFKATVRSAYAQAQLDAEVA